MNQADKPLTGNKLLELGWDLITGWYYSNKRSVTQPVFIQSAGRTTNGIFTYNSCRLVWKMAEISRDLINSPGTSFLTVGRKEHLWVLIFYIQRSTAARLGAELIRHGTTRKYYVCHANRGSRIALKATLQYFFSLNP